MNRAIYRRARIFKWTNIVGSRKIATFFVDNNGPLHLVRPKSNTVVFGESTVEITPGNMSLLVKAWYMLDSLAKDHGVRWANSGETALKASVNGITYSISTFEEVSIINEVFGEEVYALVSKAPVHIIDIGANIGVASLFFASQTWVQRVTGFEPVKPTFERALEHVAMNPHLADKVTLYNDGLAGSDRDLSLQYSPTWKGSVGIYNTPQFVKDAGDLRVEQIHVRQASKVVEAILVESPDSKIIVKMDCEGAEYEIMEELVASGTVQNVAAFMIEWHDLGSARLAASLLDNGFIVRSIPARCDRDLGIIYAINNSQT